MFTMPGLDINVTAPPFLFSECQLRVLAIGGGGEADGGGGGGGGGSGYIQFYSGTLTADTFISLKVGDSDQSSSVTINGHSVTAAPGHGSYVGGVGADGYSGGGGYGYDSGCDGGTDGGDGEDCDYAHGGRGTGDDVTAYKMENFVLTPGDGGYYSGSGYRYGGGGGGVLVNGDGPQRDSVNQGEGYGAGGGPHFVSGVGHYDGFPGVILMEVEEH